MEKSLPLNFGKTSFNVIIYNVLTLLGLNL